MLSARVCRGQSKGKLLIGGVSAVMERMEFATWVEQMDGGIEKTRIGQGVYHSLCIVIYGVRMAKDSSFCSYFG